MLLDNLSSQDRQLYSLIVLGASTAMLLGLLGGLISFNGKANDHADTWQTSIVTVTADTLTDFTNISEQPRWFSESGLVTAEQSAEMAKKALEGQPESLKLIGIVERSGQLYVLFIPVSPTIDTNNSNASAPKGVMQFTVGEVVVGDWKLKAITKAAVILEAAKEGVEGDIREISLYQTAK